MSAYQLFSATGCSRCKIVKSFMEQAETKFVEWDIKSRGNEQFIQFYKKHRCDVYRGENGIEFPILHTGQDTIQGAGMILAYLTGGKKLLSFVTRSDLSQDWIGGLNIHARSIQSESDEEQAIFRIVQTLYKNGLKIQLEADGRNPDTLRKLAEAKVVSRLLFYLRGPSELYGSITGAHLDELALEESLALLSKFPEYRIVLPVSAFVREDGTPGYLTPEEAAQASRQAETATGSKTHPFFIQPVQPPDKIPIEPLPGSAYFKYRTQCRRYMAKCEIMKP